DRRLRLLRVHGLLLPATKESVRRDGNRTRLRLARETSSGRGTRFAGVRKIDATVIFFTYRRRRPGEYRACVLRFPMSRLGVLSLVSFTLVTAIALRHRTRDGSTPEVPGSGAGGMDARMPAAGSGRRTSDGGDAAQAHSARPAGDDVVYRALVAFATGGLVVGLGAHWMRDRQVRRGAHPATG